MHRWSKNIIKPFDPGKKPKDKPEVIWFPKCLDCGCLIAPNGKGFLFRPTSTSPWVTEEPACARKVPVEVKKPKTDTSPFKQILPCPFCGVTEDRNHDPLKHVNPNVGMRIEVFEALVKRCRRALQSPIQQSEWEQELEKEHPRHVIRAAIRHAKT